MKNESGLVTLKNGHAYVKLGTGIKLEPSDHISLTRMLSESIGMLGFLWIVNRTENSFDIESSSAMDQSSVWWAILRIEPG